MRTYLSIFLMFFGVSGLWAPVCAEPSKTVSNSSLTSLVKGIVAIDNNSPKMAKQIEATAQKFEEEIDRNTGQLKASIELKANALQTQADEKSKEIFHHCAQEVERLQASVAEETQELKRIAREEIQTLRRTAAEHLMAITTQVEEEAFKAKQVARREFLEKKLASYPNESDMWKEHLKEEFSSTINCLKQIIQQGESPAQAEDFMKHFDAQTTWFDNILATTHSMSDQGYYQLNQKAEALANIVDAQKKAEKALAQRYKKSSNDANYKKLRLLILYEINDCIRQKSGSGIAAVASTVLSSIDIDKVINSVINPVPVKKQAEALNNAADQEEKMPEVKEKQGHDKPSQEKTPSLESIKLAELAEKVEQGKNVLVSAIEKASLNTQQAIDAASKKTTDDTTQKVAQKLGSQFELLNKDQLEMHSIILETQQKIPRLKDQPLSANLDITKTLLTDKEPTPQSKESFIRFQETRNRQSIETELESMQNKALAAKL